MKGDIRYHVQRSRMRTHLMKDVCVATRAYDTRSACGSLHYTVISTSVFEIPKGVTEGLDRVDCRACRVIVDKRQAKGTL